MNFPPSLPEQRRGIEKGERMGFRPRDRKKKSVFGPGQGKKMISSPPPGLPCSRRYDVIKRQGKCRKKWKKINSIFLFTAFSVKKNKFPIRQKHPPPATYIPFLHPTLNPREKGEKKHLGSHFTLFFHTSTPDRPGNRRSPTPSHTRSAPPCRLSLLSCPLSLSPYSRWQEQDW